MTRMATTWEAPEHSGLDNSLEALEYSARVKAEGGKRSVGMVVAEGMWQPSDDDSGSDEE
jgi:hypothetical protein